MKTNELTTKDRTAILDSVLPGVERISLAPTIYDLEKRSTQIGIDLEVLINEERKKEYKSIDDQGNVSLERNPNVARVEFRSHIVEPDGRRIEYPHTVVIRVKAKLAIPASEAIKCWKNGNRFNVIHSGAKQNLEDDFISSVKEI